MNEAKSILDGIAVKSTWGAVKSAPPAHLSVVGACCKCGAPIYGPSLVMQGDAIPLQFSCQCQHSNQTRTT